MPLLPRIANLFFRTRVEREIEAEIQSHIDLRIDDNLTAGMSEEEARRDALLRFGNRTSTKERVASVDFALGLQSIWSDLRYAARQLRHSPGFTVTAVLTLAVAICANAVVFSVLDALVLRPLNLPNSQRLYTVEQRELLNSYPDFRDLRDRNRAFDAVAAYVIAPVGLNTGGNPTEAWVIEASGNYFDVLGVKPYLGRFFQNSDEHGPDSAPYTVLSYSYWKNHFQGDSGIIGRTVEINRHAFTILGVAPPQFRGIELFFWPDMWTPLVDQAQIEGSSSLDERYYRDLFLIGRLKPHVTLAQANADLNSVAIYLKKTYPRDDDGMLFRLTKPGLGGDFLGPPVRAFMTGLMLLAGLILLAACANLGGLFSARAADRSREIALRVALGSTRRRVLRQLLTEAVVISIAGGVAGIAGSVALLRAISAWQPIPIYPIHLPVNPDGLTYAFAVLLALLSGLLFGLAPLRQVFATAPWQVVKTAACTRQGRHWFSTREVLLVIQIAACAVLTTASLVAVRGLERSLHATFGFQPQNALVVTTDLNMAGYSADRAPAMQRRMIDAVAALPGVSSTGLIDNLPFTGTNEVPVFGSNASDFRSSRALTETYRYNASPGYFQAAGTTLLAGRSFTWDDDKNAVPVAVVNREFARKVFGSVQAAIGRHFRTGAKTRLLIVGVVEDGKYSSLTEAPWAVFFRPLLQDPSFATSQIVRSEGDPQQVSAAVQRTIRGLDDALPFTVSPWQQELSFALFAARMATISLGVLGLLGALLALTGIFGLASYSVSKRLREFGIRIALGAKRSELLEAALGRAFKLLAAGSVAGLILGLLATKVLAYVVYEATPRDPLVLAGAVLAMLLLGLIATWLPAQRALSIDPGKLLREE
ncbi:MAG TPA: ABC transporter permease [Terracidiphilus sp.]|nr:ABC transporter permease [Terracidiphilus sp.]